MPIDPHPSYTGFNHDRAIQLRSGRILMPLFYTKDYRIDKHIRSRVYYSDDEGATWLPSKTIVDVEDSKPGAQEPGVVELKDGRVMMWMRADTGQDPPLLFERPRRDVVDARGDGTRFAAFAAVDQAHSVHRRPAAGLEQFAQGPLPPHDRHLPGRGRTWENIRNLDEDPAHTYAYTSIEFVRDRVLFTYYAGPPAGKREGPLWSLKLKSVPVTWLYRAETRP